MLISEYLRLRNIASAVTTANNPEYTEKNRRDMSGRTDSTPFAEELKKQLSAASAPAEVSCEELERNSSVRFSKHAVERINQRGIDMYASDRLDRLNRAVELAEEKNSDEALVFIDSAAFLVSVRNNKVITAVTAEDIQGNIFTNIDSTVVM